MGEGRRKGERKNAIFYVIAKHSEAIITAETQLEIIHGASAGHVPPSPRGQAHGQIVSWDANFKLVGT